MTVPKTAIARLILATGALFVSAFFCFHNLPKQGDLQRSGDPGEGYKISELVYMGATHTFSYVGFNNLGHISGSVFAPDGRYVAALFDGKRLSILGALPGDIGSRVYGMNDSDVVVGASYKNDNHYSLRTTHAFLWEGGKMRLLPPVAGLPLSRAWAVNSHSEAVGNSYRPLNEQRDTQSIPTLWRGGTPAALPLPRGAVQGIAYSINDADQVAGNVTMADGSSRACRWENSKAELLEPLPGDKATAAASINASGSVLASSSGVENRIVVWNRDGCEQLGRMPGVSKLQPVKINDGGDCIVNDPDTPGYPVLWTRKSGFVRISHLIPQTAGYSLWKGLGLNNRGQIAVGGRYLGTKTSVFLVSPPTVAESSESAWRRS